MDNDIILIGHGSGGRLSHELVVTIFLPYFSNPSLNLLADASVIQLNHGKSAITTDSYVIDPIFFPGGDIGKLAVSGTVNDLCVTGAVPQYMTAAFILEEGLPVADLKRVVQSMAAEAKRAGVQIVAGDTKVVKRGQCDKLYINTCGIGILQENRSHLSSGNTIADGDSVLVTGFLGDHAIAILAEREKIRLEENILSDVAPLNLLTEEILTIPENIRFMRDITRGGLATILVECCQKKDFGIVIEERALPVNKSVRAVCDLYGYEPVNLANEGKIMLIVKHGQENAILRQLHANPMGINASVIGSITSAHPGRVIMETISGGNRIIEMLSGEMLPRIC